MGCWLLAASVVPLSTSYPIADAVGAPRLVSACLAKRRCSTTFSLFKIVIGTAVVLAPGNPLGGCFLYQFFEGNYGLIHPSNTGGRGVAFFAHVGGFIFGAVVAGFLSGRDASPSRRHDGRQRRSVRRDGPVMPALPDDGKVRH